MRRIFIACALTALPLTAQAGTAGEEDAMVINRLNSTDFEVVETRSMGAADFWCGAATFVERRSGLSETTPIYLKRARGPSGTVPGRNGVVFSTSNSGLPTSQGRISVSVERPGDVLKSAQARRFCRDAFTRATK
ncbi:hypothetical protein [Sulfitobacter sp. JB4-11]|uniref:hypothetical protein n=1 Tax=Sulfitobacter rhodophyticola TaxID=3238304 RepID=UPI0035143F78